MKGKTMTRELRMVPHLAASTHTASTGLGLARFEVDVLPTIWFLAPDGKALGRASGARDWESVAFDALVRRWLNDDLPRGQPSRIMKPSE